MNYMYESPYPFSIVSIGFYPDLFEVGYLSHTELIISRVIEERNTHMISLLS